MNRIIRYTYPRSTSLLANRSPWTGLESEIVPPFRQRLSDLATPASAPRFPVDPL